MTERLDIAVVGATGAVGEAMLSILSERKFPVGKVHALASERSAGSKVNFGNGELIVEDLAEFDFSQVQLGLFSAGGSVSVTQVRPHQRVTELRSLINADYLEVQGDLLLSRDFIGGQPCA